MIDWTYLTKLLEEKWLKEGKLPCPMIIDTDTPPTNHTAIGLYFADRDESNCRVTYKLADKFSFNGFTYTGRIENKAIIKELWPQIKNTQIGIELMAFLLGDNNDRL